MASRPGTVGLHDHAIDNLRYIRATMERAASFTAVPGTGGIFMGLTALFAAMAAMNYPGFFLQIWFAAAALALLIGVGTTVQKARAMKVELDSGPARKFALAFTPPLVVGAILTLALLRVHATELLPGTWLSLYGTAVIAGGAFSVRIIPLLGIGFLCAGAAALFTPPSWGNTWLAVGFGAGHIVVGTVISRRYGGEQSAAKIPPPASPTAINDAAAKETTGLDRLIHERMRLGIVSALAANESLTFVELKKLLDATDGNVSIHARKLEEAGYITCTKSFEARVPRTEFRLAPAGRRALTKYLDHMESLIRAMRSA